MERLPPHLIRKIMSNVNKSPGVYIKLNKDGSPSYKKGEIKNTRVYGNNVLPKLSGLNVSKKISQSVQDGRVVSAKTAHVLREKYNLPSDVIQLINVMKNTVNKPYLPIKNDYYGTKNNVNRAASNRSKPQKSVYYRPFHGYKNTSIYRLPPEVHRLPKKDYIPVKFDQTSGLYKKVPQNQVYKQNNVIFVTNTQIRKMSMPTNF